MPGRTVTGCDVCVVGGGPAGSTIATRLAMLGHRVVVAESQRFPRPHIGISIGPEVLSLLDGLHVREKVETAGFVRAHRSVIWWAEPAPRVRIDSVHAGLHVDRGKFD